MGDRELPTPGQLFAQDEGPPLGVLQRSSLCWTSSYYDKMLKWKFPLRQHDSTDGKFQSQGPDHFVEISKKLTELAQRAIRRI